MGNERAVIEAVLFARDSGTDRGHSIAGREMKFQDPGWTDGGESDVLVRVCRSRTKVRISKVIRYRCSSQQ